MIQSLPRLGHSEGRAIRLEIGSGLNHLVPVHGSFGFSETLGMVVDTETVRFDVFGGNGCLTHIHALRGSAEGFAGLSDQWRACALTADEYPAG